MLLFTICWLENVQYLELFLFLSVTNVLCDKSIKAEKESTKCENKCDI